MNRLGVCGTFTISGTESPDSMYEEVNEDAQTRTLKGRVTDFRRKGGLVYVKLELQDVKISFFYIFIWIKILFFS